jgi:cysteinyl-tRNA synthetase
MPDPPKEIVELAERRARARAAKDFAEANAIYKRIASVKWKVEDAPGGGYTLAPVETTVDERVAARGVVSVLDEPATADVSVQWVCEGWPDDIERAIASLRTHAAGHALQFVVADVTGEPADRWGEDVEVVRLEEGTGWAAARNAGLRRARGRLVFAMDGSIEATGDVVAPIEAALADASVGVCGPFGIVTSDLREFDEAPGVGPCDAVEGYLMAFRREIVTEAGAFDEKFTWYRTADIEWSFRVKDAGYRCEVVAAPVARHEHRMWFETPPQERAKWSKRNFYRFLDRWRDRWDLVLSGDPNMSRG